MAQIHKNGTPAYQRIRTAILKRIEAGQLKAGDSVDSERELARINKVSLMTARHALATLEKEGMVERRRGRRHFCRAAENPFQQTDELHRTDGQPRSGRWLTPSVQPC